MIDPQLLDPRPYLGVANSFSGKVWRERELDEKLAGEHARQMKSHELVGRLLAGRGVALDERELFLNPTLKALFPDPSTFADMDVAAAAILDAIVSGRPTAVFADYDVDGGTSSAILARYFRAWGRELILYVPDRLMEGFGPTPGAFRALKAQGAELVVTVDCGAAAIEALRTANEIGLDVVVLDHHLMHDAHTPPTLALVNPNRPDCKSGHGHLAAAGVVFVMAVALNRLARARGIAPEGGLPDPMKWLDLAALGTLCDMAPLKGVNRAFVTRGLEVLARQENAGLAALAQVADIEAPKSVYHATFVLGPRLNAGGRIGDPWIAARLLATDDRAEAIRLAEMLQELNAQRKDVEAAILEAATFQADERLARNPDTGVIVAGAEGWHPGVIGIVAGRLKERFHRPAVVIGWGDGLGPVARGSGRSVAGVNLGELISQAAREGIILGGGGHAMAAGLSLTPDQLPAFRDWMENATAGAIAERAQARVLEIDGAMAPGAANSGLLEMIERVGPFGSGAPEPVFAVPNVRASAARRVGETHLAFEMVGENGAKLRAIAFRIADAPEGQAILRGERLHVAGRLRGDAFRGAGAVQLEVVDVARVEPGGG
ncbi:MAG: single-stranded-DNA-specific exonuclease RecJ [Alphaproteobacteria bacterium]|nr:single-stranded-DNA-specific exonuclease RecJ [Alphaproteobacteria bacterium]